MRTYGRDENGKWVKIETDANGFNDSIWITTLAQNLKLAPQESPFFAENGIPAYGSIIQQILPTFYVNRIQQQFAGHFATLQITIASTDPPVYNVRIITKSGSVFIREVAV